MPANHQFNVLFLCTGNSARSILAEALMNRWGKGKFKAYSAGSNPKGEIHPKTIEILNKNHFNTTGCRSKSWDEFTGADAPEIDFIITVCSSAANETCPIIPGNPASAHWDIADPARQFDSEEDQDKAFLTAFMELDQRIQLLIDLPSEKLDKIALHEHIHKISDQK
ncbi:MAG: arsenate reductase ArsC [Proteobacteria bacterium]|nr:arsenate reductase ArsC [Pseudomonadota bacterium]NOG61583.1 arsenate reductase ArsC [Pseudomonadota bacterium]